MRPYVPALLWLTAGALALAFKVYAGSSRFRRSSRTLSIALPAVAFLYAAQPVLESAARHDNGLIGAAGVFLGTAALVGFVAAGWSAVWVSGDRKPDEEAASHQDTLSDASGPGDGGGTARL